MKKLLTLLLSFISLISLQACMNKDFVVIVPAPEKIAIAPFNQPTTNGQLLAGYIPQNQNYIDEQTLEKYNKILQYKLSQTHRHYIFLSSNDLNITIKKDSKNRPNVLATWAYLAQKAGAEYIIVPQILDHQEKQGKDRDVTMPARLVTDYYLIKVIHPETKSTDGFLQARSHYKEKSFIQVNVSGEDYITPRQHKNIVEFVEESINKMIYEFHLTLN